MPATVTLSPSADNTLYQDLLGTLSNGAGQHFYVGDTVQSSNYIRRGAIKFDISTIPAGSTITSVSLNLNMSKTKAGAQPIDAHRALRDWGEGTSNAGAGGTGVGEGDGASAALNELTWIYSNFSSQRWTVAGGDFVAATSASTSVNGNGHYTWSGAGMVADVQSWLNNPGTSFGWILTGNETAKPTVKQFDTKENATPANRPVLTITYNPPVPDLTITKSHVGNFRQGDTADTYTLIVRNSGQGATSGTVTVTDTLPAGLSPTAADSGAINGWSVAFSGQTITATRSDVLAGSSSYPALTLTVSVASNAAASVTNSTSVSGGGETNTSNNSASDVTTIAPVADLTLSKSHSADFRQGDAADTYSLTVNNVGPGSTLGTVTVTDTLPLGLSATAADMGTINGWTVSFSGQIITATRSDVLPSGNSYPVLTLTVSVASNASGVVTNSASVSGGGELVTSNNSATDPTVVAQVADLSVAKSHIGVFRQGDAADQYTLTVSNFGLGPTVGAVTLTDTLPAGLAPTAANAGVINGWSVSFNGQVVTATRSDALATMSSYPPLIVTVAVSPTAPASLTNSAAVAGGGELNTSNNAATDPTSITQLADLTIAKSHTGVFHPGDSADLYTISVANIGAAATDGSEVVVIDTLPTGLTPTAANSGVINGWSLSFSGQIITATRSDVLASGGIYPDLTVTVAVADNVALNVTNTAMVSGGGQVNTANDTVADSTATTPVADLTIEKSHAGNFRQGDAADVYTLTVHNIGPAATVGAVTVVDTLPTGLSPTAANTGVINGWSLSFSGQVITATRSDALGAGGSYPALTIAVSIALNAAASVTNHAVVSGGGENHFENDAADDVTTIIQIADLTVSKSHSGAFRQGDAADVYTLKVNNIGSGPTVGAVTVVDTLPTGLSPTVADNGTINGWIVSFVGQVITATRSDSLGAASSYPDLTLTVAVSETAVASVTNTAAVSGGGEIVTANNSASDATVITQVADLTVSMNHNGNFRQGDAAATYTVTVNNVGTGPTSGAVTVIDTLPVGLTPTAANSGNINGWTVTVSGQIVTATRGDVLAAGQSYPALTLTVSVASNAAPGVVNSAVVSGGGEVKLNNNAASDITTIAQVADLTIGMSHGSTVSQGDASAAYTLVVSNAGPGPTVGVVTIVVAFPAGLMPTAANTGNISGWSVSYSGQTITAQRSDILASGASYPTLTVTVSVGVDAAASLSNSATVTGGGELNSGNDIAYDTTSIVQIRRRRGA